MRRLVLLMVILALAAACNSRHTSAGAPSASSQQPVRAIREATIPVEGMSCGSCVARVKRRLKAIDGVAEVDVSLEHRNAVVRYDEAKITPERLAGAIDDLGYTAGAPVVSPPAGDAL